MAGRPKEKDTDFKMGLRKIGKYRYAETHPYVTDSETGERKRRYIIWGDVTEDWKFIPNDRYILLPESERAKFIFPEGWDLSTAESILAARMKIPISTDPFVENDGSAFSGTVQTIPVEGQFNNRFYGGPWFLWGIGVNKHIIEDLLEVFDHQQGIVNDIMTLAMYPILTKWSYAQVERWQGYTKTPSNHPLSASYITKFTQSITDNHRMGFLKLRIGRQKESALVACDSTTRSGYGRCLADIRWGKNKDNAALQNTLEVVVYSIDTHEPIYYRTFAGNENDGRTLRTIVSDLKALGCKDLTIIFDRGYISEENLTEMIRAKQPFLVCGKVGQKPVYNSLEKVKYSEYGIPLNLNRYGDGHLYVGQFEEDFIVSNNPENPSASVTTKLKINLFVDLVDRMKELDDLHTAMKKEEELLAPLQGTVITKQRLSELKKDCKYHRLKLEDDGRLSVAPNVNAIKKAENTAGFFSSVAYLVDGDAASHYELYVLRDDQEKYFEEMKDQLGFNMQQNWSEEGKTGRLFILFVGLILHTTVRNVWKEQLKEKHRSSVDVLHTMLPIRFVEYEDGTTHVTSFTTPQADICSAFSLPIPEDCLSASQKKELGRKTSSNTRGRPKGSLNKSKAVS